LFSIPTSLATAQICVQSFILMLLIGLDDERIEMNIRDLKYISAIAKIHHFGKAAEACYVSQPTLSGQIKKLEQQLGVKIFERTNRRVMPTDIGLEIIAHANNILSEVDQILELAESAQDPLSAKFRLGAFPTLASYVFPNLVNGIKETMPKLRLALLEEKTGVLIKKLKAGQIDAALLAMPVEEDFFQCAELFTDEFMLATPPDHELASSSAIKPDTLSGHKLLLLEEGHCLRDQALDVCENNGINETQDFRATSLETLRQMVKAGSGITFMPKIAIYENEMGIHYTPFSSPAPSRTIGLYWRKTSVKTKVIEKLVGLLKKDK